MANRLRYVVQVLSGEDTTSLLEYQRDSYGALNLAELLAEVSHGLENLTPHVGAPLHITVMVVRYDA